MTADHYADGTYRWWHLSRPSPELTAALDDGWLAGPGRVLDLGCGLGTEAGYLASAGWQAVGVDLSAAALTRAAGLHPATRFLRADLRQLPFRRGCFDVLLDRGCFHYLAAGDRPRYAAEAERVLRPGAKLLLRASMRAAGVRNDIDEAVIRRTFRAWRIVDMERGAGPSDTRMLEFLVVRLEAASG
jgi:SAM-dependent methyltransferase